MTLIQIESAGLGMIPTLDEGNFFSRGRRMPINLRRRIDFENRPVVPIETPTPIQAPVDWWTPIVERWRARPWSLSSFQDLMTQLKAAEVARAVAPVSTTPAPTPAPAPAPAGSTSMFAVPSASSAMVSIGAPSGGSMFATPSGTGSQTTKQSGANALSGLDDVGTTGRVIAMVAVAALGFGLGYFGPAWMKKHWGRA
ncbi:MAG TPA: hypothetical protein VJ549_00490 [Geothrix sp.]|nr:hypothetical protein [Geothrix sp.]HJV47725.1 hypothetical protein [Geothrix sp.]